MRRCLGLGLGLVLLLAVPAHAAPAWLPGAEVPGQGSPARFPEIGFAADGTLVAVWLEGAGGTERVRAAVRPPGGPFGAVQTLAGPMPGLGSPQIAVDAAGNAVATWGQLAGGRYAVLPAGGRFGASQELPRPPGENVNSAIAVGFAPDGAAVAAWRGVASRPGGGHDLYLRASVRPRGGAFAAPVALDFGFDHVDVAGTPSFQVPAFDVGAAGSGDLIVAWTSLCCESGTESSAVHASVRPSGGAFGPAQTMDSEPANETVIDYPRVAGAPDGSALAAWPRRGTAGQGIVRTCRRPPGGAFLGCEWQNASGDGTAPHTLDLGMDARGRAVASWARRLPDGTGSTAIQAAARGAGGSAWAGPKTYAVTGTELLDPSLGVAPGGSALLAWSRGGERIDGATRPAGGAFGDARPLSGSGATAFPDVAMDAEGNGAAIWQRGAPPGTKVEVAGYDGAPPRLSGLSIPSWGPTGQPLPYAVAATDVWSPLAVAWRFSDGASLSGAVVERVFRGTGGDIDATVTATDALGNSASGSGRTRVLDATRPRLRDLTVDPSRFPSGSGTTFRFGLSEPARVTFLIERALRGRRAGGECRRRARQGRRCTIFRRAGAFRRRLGAGANAVAWSGRLRKRALKPGRYRATLRAEDPAGNRSPRRTVRLRIVR